MECINYLWLFVEVSVLSVVDGLSEFGIEILVGVDWIFFGGDLGGISYWSIIV